MKTSLTKRPRYAAFTLIEMIGVLAVIAILASLLIPKIFNAINDAKVNNAALSYNSIKTAVIEHYGKFGKFTGPNNVTLTDTMRDNFDSLVLLADQMIDKPFAVKIGDGAVTTRVRLVPADPTSTAVSAPLAPAAIATATTGYNLDGSTANNQIPVGSLVAEAVILGVAEADAKALNDRVDGVTLGVTALGNDDFKGRVKYTKPASAGAPVTVYVYIAHR